MQMEAYSAQRSVCGNAGGKVCAIEASGKMSYNLMDDECKQQVIMHDEL